MITLITGAPGTGKSNALVSMLAGLGKDRQLYVFGIPDLKIPHVALDDPTTWPDTVPDGSCVILDEVQNVWRPRGPGQKVPDHVAKLETHRHRGLDFYIITQGPNLVDSNVRALVGRHVHLRDLGILGRWWYEWPECADNCRTSWKNAPIKKRYRLDKAAQAQYKSASIHVKPIRSVPWMVLVMLVALLTVGVMTWKAYGMIQAKVAPAKPASVQTAKSGGVGPPPTVQASAAKVIDDRVDFIPRLAHIPDTAPAYDHLRKVVNRPVVAGAIFMGDKYRCVTQQGTDAGLSERDCRQWAENRPFDAFTEPPAPATAQQAPPGARLDAPQPVEPPTLIGGSMGRVAGGVGASRM